jgi:hypothetical protein
MTEENTLPQVDDGLVVNTTPDSPETPSQGAELATATEVEQTKPQEPEHSESAQKAINKKHWQVKEAERKNADLQRQVDELKAGAQAPSVAPNVPDIPDPLELTDDEFRLQMQERDRLFQENARYEVNTQRQQEEAQREQLAAQDKIRSDFASKATGLGLNAEDVLRQTAEVVGYGVSDAVAEMIATEADGPLLASYLRQHPNELDALRGMTTVAQQVSHMANTVRQGAESLKPKTSNAPPPPTDISAGGSLNEVDPLLEGLTINV